MATCSYARIKGHPTPPQCSLETARCHTCGGGRTNPLGFGRLFDSPVTMATVSGALLDVLTRVCWEFLQLCHCKVVRPLDFAVNAERPPG